MKVLMWMGGSFDRRTPSEHLLVAIVQALISDGHKVHIIQKDTAGPLPKLPLELEKLNITTDCVSCQLAAKSNFIARYFVELKYILKCKKLIKKYKDYDAVFNQSSNVAGLMALIIKRIMPQARLTYNVQDIFPENLAYIGNINSVAYKVLSLEQRYAYNHADEIITISDDMKDLLIEKGVDSRKIDVVYNWSYRDQLYEYDDIYSDKIACFLPSNKFNVVYAGNIGTMQNVDVMTSAARLLNGDKNIQFHIFGSGLFKDRLQHETEGLDNISFWPMQSSELAPSIYGMADLNIIPLAHNIYRTALPSKTATCIACQKPIVFCIGENSKFGRWISKEDGYYLIESGQAEKLAFTIKTIKENYVIPQSKTIFLSFTKTKNSKHYAKLIVGEK